MWNGIALYTVITTLWPPNKPKEEGGASESKVGSSSSNGGKESDTQTGWSWFFRPNISPNKSYDRLFEEDPLRMSFNTLDSGLRQQTHNRGWSMDFYSLDKILGASQEVLDVTYGWGDASQTSNLGIALRMRMGENGRIKFAIAKSITQPRHLQAQFVIQDMKSSSESFDYRTNVVLTNRTGNINYQLKYFGHNCMPWSTPDWQPNPRSSARKISLPSAQVCGIGANFMMHQTQDAAFGVELLVMKKRKLETQLHTVVGFAGQFRPSEFVTFTGRVDSNSECKGTATFAVPFAFPFLWLIPGLSLFGLTLNNTNTLKPALVIEGAHCPYKRDAINNISLTYELEDLSSIRTSNKLDSKAIFGKLQLKAALDGKLSGRVEFGFPAVNTSLAAHCLYSAPTGDYMTGIEFSFNKYK